MNAKKKILAFGASNSKKSINKQLASYAASQIEGAHVTVLDLNDFEMPLYGIDKENDLGIPDLAYAFKEHILNSDGIIISFAEHNGAYSVAFKNIFDWISRIDKNTWDNKPLFLLATSPGGRGGQSVLDLAFNKFKRMTNNEVLRFSLPSFSKNFDMENGINDPSLKGLFNEELKKFFEAL